MQIKKTGFVYRVAYAHTCELNKPNKVSLCPLFWRFMFMFFIGVPLSYLIYFIIIAVIIRGCFFLFAGARFRVNKTKDLDPLEWTCTPSPMNMPTIRGERITPVFMAIIGLALFWLYAASSSLVAATTIAATKTASVVTSLAFWLTLVAISIVATIIFLLVRAPKTEAWALLKAWLKAKKQKVCPIIEVVDE